MDFRNYLTIIWRRKTIISTIALIAFLTVTLYSLFATPIYRAVATLRVSTAARGSLDWIDYDILYTDRVMRTYEEIANSPELLTKLTAQLKLTTPPLVAVTIVPDSELMAIAVDYADAEVAAAAANLLAQLLLNENATISTLSEEQARTMLEERLQQAEAELATAKVTYDQLAEQLEVDAPEVSAAARTVALRQEVYDALVQQYRQVSVREAVQTNTLVIVAPATVPASASKPNLQQDSLLGAALGLLGGLALAFLMEQFDRTLHDSAAITAITRLPVLGKLPASRHFRAAASGRLNSRMQEALRRLGTNLLVRAEKEPVKTILITSAEPRAGTTTVAVWLAAALAQRGQRILLIDANLRKPLLHRAYGLPNVTGFSDLLLGKPIEADVIQSTGSSMLHLLSSGLRPERAVPALGLARTQELLHELAALYDLILVDSSAVGAASETTRLARQVDGVICVVARGQTNSERLAEALHALRFVDAPLLGIIINRAEVPRRYRSYELAETEELALVITKPAIIDKKEAEHHVHANNIPVEQAVSGHEAAEPASALR